MSQVTNPRKKSPSTYREEVVRYTEEKLSEGMSREEIIAELQEMYNDPTALSLIVKSVIDPQAIDV